MSNIIEYFEKTKLESKKRIINPMNTREAKPEIKKQE